MRNLVILGGGTGGTIEDEDHLYQAGLLLLPFGGYNAEDLVRPRRRHLREVTAGAQLLFI